MICHRIHLFKILATTTLIFISTSVLVAGERDDLYSEGMAAYSNQDHVEALKKLYAFYVLNEVKITKKPKFEKQLKEKITLSEKILELALATNSSVQLGKKRTKFIISQGQGTFIGTASEIDDLLDKKVIDLKAIKELNHKVLRMPSSELSR